MKMTMQKIAELAGVSRGAVDKTIHNRPGVKPEIRKKILRVIEETGYTPLKDRKQMVSPMRAKTVTVILPRLTNPYFIVLKQSLETLSATLPNIQLQFYPCNSTDVRGILDILDRTQQSTDAYLFRGVNSTAICQKLNDIGKPVIFFDSDVPGAERLCLIAEDWHGRRCHGAHSQGNRHVFHQSDAGRTGSCHAGHVISVFHGRQTPGTDADSSIYYDFFR